MKINLSELSYKDKIEINDTFNFSEDYLGKCDIKKLDNVKVTGYLYQNSVDEYCSYLEVEGKMMLLDSVTLAPIDYDFSFTLDDILDERCINEQNVLDIMELLWENIVLEVPIRYTKSDAENLKGDNWEVLSETSKEEEIDPRMQKLYELYKGGE